MRIKIHETQCGSPRVHRMNRKAWFKVLTRWRSKNDEERMRKVEERLKPLRNSSRKRYGSVSEAPRLRFSSWKQFFQANSKEREVPKGLNPFLLHFLPYLYQNRGDSCRPARPGEPGWFFQKQQPSGGSFWKAQVGLIAIYTPLFTKCTPPFYFFVILFP